MGGWSLHRLRLVSLFVLAVVFTGCGSPSFKGSVLDEPVSVPDFALTDHQGERFRLSDQRGRVVLLFFGYTSCPDVCPTTLATWRRVQEGLGEDSERVRFVFVTVDPERDTPERLRLHVTAFSPDFVGLTGTPEELEAVYEAFDVFYQKDAVPESALGYLISHTATAFVLDGDGQWRLRETYGTPAEDIVHDIRQLLGS